MIDYTNYPVSERYYGGTEKKIGVLISGSEYMLKFQKHTAFGYRNNHICEYIGSHVFELLGFPAQETYLGTYQGEQVVACKNFIPDGDQFVPFNDVGESTLDQDRERYQYGYADIMQMLRDNSKLTHVDETIQAFWEMFLVDALLGNFDRHGGNWGFLKRENAYRLAPVFDNGSCLYPNLTDEADMLHILSSEEETIKRVFTFPTSQVKLNGKKSSYFDVIHSLAFKECTSALISIHARIDMERLHNLIEEIPMLSRTQKDFYRHMLEARYRLILADSIERIAVGGMA